MNQSRRKGATTRLVDAAIQELFIVGYVKINDHFDNKSFDEQLAHRICRRMMNEHNIEVSLELGRGGLFGYIYSIPDFLKIDKNPSFLTRLKNGLNYIFNGK